MQARKQKPNFKKFASKKASKQIAEALCTKNTKSKQPNWKILMTKRAMNQARKEQECLKRRKRGSSQAKYK